MKNLARVLRNAECGAEEPVFPRLLPLLAPLVFLSLLSACATAPTLPPPPPRYVYASAETAQPRPAMNSLWRDTASLYEDVKARRLNDLLTINVVENISGSGSADTSASKQSTVDASVNALFGLPINSMSFRGRYSPLSPTVNGSMSDAFKGSGSTTRSGTLMGTITAKVVEVMPNGNLAVESRKEITINNEKQVLVLRGMVRPDDIAIDNTVLSSRVSDAQVFFVGDGVVQDKQKPGWLVQVLDAIWPF